MGEGLKIWRKEGRMKSAMVIFGNNGYFGHRALEEVEPTVD